MQCKAFIEGFDFATAGAMAYGIVEELYPICRSITGDGLRESLRRLQRVVPLELHEVASGTPVFDWIVPNEWNIRDAYIKNATGTRVVDFRVSNLHVLNYSVPIHRAMPLAELRPHLHSLPETPDWIPYRTSYYREDWGFCLTHRQLEQFEREGGNYEVCIDSTLEPGHLTYGELKIPGESSSEVLLSSHSCHPSLANDNLSGMAVAACLARILSSRRLRYTYRFVWAPGTIGAIAWLSRNEAILSQIEHGLVISGVGDPGPFTYKRSRRGSAAIDRVVEHVLRHSGAPCSIEDFTPLGYDERQYCSPGINLPVGCFMRTPHGRYPEYHTSADNLQFVTPAALEDSLAQLLRIVWAAETDPPNNSREPEPSAAASGVNRPASQLDPGDRGHREGAGVADRHYLNLFPKGEPQLGRRGLFRATGGVTSPRTEEALLWVLNLSDGHHSVRAIADCSGLLEEEVTAAAERLEACGLLRVESE